MTTPNRRLHILQHSLGLDQYGDGRQYRNHFCAGPGNADYDDCRALAADGLMHEHASSELSGGYPVFSVTPAGVDFVTRHSPARPREKKLSRSQKRYRAWLASDCGLSFGEWLTR